MKTLKLNAKPVLNKKGGLITSEDALLTKINRFNQKNLAVSISYKVAAHDIHEGACVFIDDNKLNVASSLLKSSECIGVSFKACASGEKASYITKGKATSNNFNFTVPFGRPVWVGASGKPTDVVPSSGYLQMIGVSIDAHSFIVGPLKKIFTNTRDFKNKTEIPVLLHRGINSDSSEIPVGSPMLISQEKLVASRPISIATREQTIPSDVWQFRVNETVSNVQVLVHDGRTLVLNTSNVVKIEDGVMYVTFDTPKIGVVNFCILN